jgi:biotin transport system substrate-specific component
LVYADVLRPARKHSAWLYDGTVIIGGSLFVALSAQVAIPLPFSPVPITGQTLAVLLVGMLLGRTRGSLAMLAYLAEGAAGLPVYAGGTAGLARLLGPTGGYLVGFVVAAFVAGFLAERGWDRHVVTTILAMILGNIAIYCCGLLWLTHFIGSAHLLALGLLPFLPGDAIKIVIAAILLPAGWKALGRQGRATLRQPRI